ncbi:MAG: hypothetical protein PHW02_03210 [bacterium]|nr:hypothetical protein [bacterium]
MILLIVLTLTLLIIAYLKDKKRCFRGIVKGCKMFLNILPALLSILAIISILLYLVPQEKLLLLFGREAGLMGWILAALVGSITLMPGFISYPLAGILVKNGVSYPVVAVFITTLMMVGIVTLPVEKRFFGLKAALIRNGFSFLGALMVGSAIGIVWMVI